MTADPSTTNSKPVTGAVIIPAHNEQHAIVHALDGLAPLARGGSIEILVVCNGCSDDTADVARSYPGVTVIETDVPSKPAALNLGDETASSWPRLYLDADIGIEVEAVLAVFRELARPDGARAGRPDSIVDAHESTFPVRAYYRARARIPEAGTRLWGAGGYAVSEEGHDRFPAFPDVTADDSWFDGLFAEDEKTIVSSAPMRVRAPLTTATLLDILTRHRRGQVELAIPSDSRRRLSSLLGSVRGIPSAVDAVYYAALTVAARLRSRRSVGLGTSEWETDASTRGAGTRGTVNAS